MKLTLLFLLSCFHGFLLASTPPSLAIDIIHYDFELELSDSTNAISGKANVTLVFKKTSDAFWLNFHSPDQGKGMTVSAVLVDGKRANFTHIDNLLRVSLPSQKEEGSKVTATISYSGIPADGLIIGKNKFGDRTFFGDNWPDRAQHWLPVVDHPSDKATVEFRVTAPIHYEVIGNGYRVEESIVSQKKKLTHWREGVPISTKVMVIGAARFAISYAGEVDGVPVEQWVYPQNRTAGFSDFAEAKKILEFFGKQIGPYPYEKLANVQSKTRYGGMENASNIFYMEAAVNGNADHNDLIAHEIAHQWFGNSATELSWEHVWLSEGFAVFMTNVYDEVSLGENVRKAKMADQRRDVIAFYKEKQWPVVLTTLPFDLMEILNKNSYQKGGWILHMLRREMGDEAFWKGIREYYKVYTGRNASTEDFQRVMQTQSNMDLTTFFRQWLFTAGHPLIKASFSSTANGVEVTIKQLQEPAFTFPIEIAFTSKDGKATEVQKVLVTEKEAKFPLKLGFKADGMTLDPNTNLLFESSVK
jgi:aminopeptidase N